MPRQLQDRYYIIMHFVFRDVIKKLVNYNKHLMNTAGIHDQSGDIYCMVN